jgi:hypothetical protein
MATNQKEREMRVGSRVESTWMWDEPEKWPGTVVEMDESEFVGVKWDHTKRGQVGRVRVSELRVVAQ